MNLKFIYYSKLLIGLTIFIIEGCTSATVGDKTEDPYIPPLTGYDDGVYIVTGAGAKQVLMEYMLHYFIPGEERTVMAFGDDGAETWTHTWLTVQNQRFSGSIGTGMNHYRDGNKFTVPIEVTVPYGLSTDPDYPTEGSINAGTDNGISKANDFVLLVEIPKREYKVHYSCMNNWNVFGELGLNTLDHVERAFSEANTDFIKIDEDLSLNEITLDIKGNNEEEEWDNLKQQINELSPTDYINWDNNTVWIFGCKDYEANFSIFYDASIPISYTSGEKRGAVFIFSRNGKYIGTSQPTLEKQEITSRVIHELGHLRGMRLSETLGYVYLLTHGVFHNNGHNGKNVGLCLMRLPGNPNDSNYTDDLLKKTIDKPHFCFGHIQMLYNCTFIEGE